MKNYKKILTLLIFILLFIGIVAFLYFNENIENKNKIQIDNNKLFIDKPDIDLNSLPQDDE